MSELVVPAFKMGFGPETAIVPAREESVLSRFLTSVVKRTSRWPSHIHAITTAPEK